MIVDVHTHVPRRQAPEGTDVQANTATRPDKPVVWAQGPESYLQAMEPVDRVICFNIAGDPRPGARGEWREPARTVNDDTAAFVRKHGAKYIGYMTLHPFDKDALDELERARTDLGLRGIK